MADAIDDSFGDFPCLPLGCPHRRYHDTVCAIHRPIPGLPFLPIYQIPHGVFPILAILGAAPDVPPSRLPVPSPLPDLPFYPLEDVFYFATGFTVFNISAPPLALPIYRIYLFF